MAFTVYVASDCFGQKVNLELEFPYAPTLGELTQAVEAAFSGEQAYRRPGHAATYQVSKFLSVDEVTDDWVEVTAASQLRNYCQIYSFQPHSTRYTETQGHIPPATKPRSCLYGMGAAESPLRHELSAAGSVPRAYAVPDGIKQLPENPTHEEKVRIAFEEIDSNRNRVIELTEFQKAFELCEFAVTKETAQDLFNKADSDRDGVLNFPEWQRFSELYPTSHDCIYFRYKHTYDKQAGQARVDAAKTLRKAMEDEQQAAQKGQEQAEEDANTSQQRVDDAERALGDAQQRQRSADDTAREQQRVADDARAVVEQRQQALQAERERERQAQLRAQDSERDLEVAQRRQQAAQQAAQAAELAEQRAQAALDEARREKERQLRAVADEEENMSRARKRHDEIMGQIPQTVDEARKAVLEAEAAAQQQDQQQRSLCSDAMNASRACDDAARARDEAARGLAQVRERKEPATRAADAAGRRLEDHDKKVGEMEEEVRKNDEKGRELWAQENQLVEQEIRLREQRDALEQKENALRNAAGSFVQQAGRTSASPAPARAGLPVGSMPYSADYGTPQKTY